MQVPQEWADALARWGPLADAEAHRYGLESGAELIAKIGWVETRLGQNNTTSTAGAQGWTQFMPGTRADYMARYHIDPWRSVDEAVHATALFMKEGGGLDSYNPGSSTYISEVLNAPVSGWDSGSSSGSPRRPGGSTPASSSSSSSSGGLFGDAERSGALKALLFVSFTLAGAGLAFGGASRMMGLRGVLPGGAAPSARPSSSTGSSSS